MVFRPACQSDAGPSLFHLSVLVLSDFAVATPLLVRRHGNVKRSVSHHARSQLEVPHFPADAVVVMTTGEKGGSAVQTLTFKERKKRNT